MKPSLLTTAKRKTACPMCGTKMSIKFDKAEFFQKGKNIKCPCCHYLLWIPIKGKPHSVPIIP